AQPEHNDETESVYESASNNEKSQSKVVSGEEKEVSSDDDSVNSQSGENEKTIFDNEKEIMDVGDLDSLEAWVNIPEDCDNALNKEFRKVFVIRKCVKFSPAMINKGLDKSAKTMAEADFPIYRVTKEISSGQVKV
ncbi:envelope-like protein, partial [Trifolium medium]|nr:envelope-like protein [Trifolium medium]